MTYNISEGPQGQVNVVAVGPANAINLQNGGIFTGAGVASFGAHIVGATGSISATGGQPSTNVTSFTGTDLAGKVFILTTASASSGNQFLVTFATAFVNAPYVTVTPATSSTAALVGFATASTNGFTWFSNTVPANSGSFAWTYSVIG